MKVMLMVNLKTAGGTIIPKGSVFTDEYKPLPGFISRKLNNPNLVKIVEEKPKYNIIDADDFTMEAPQPKQEEIFQEKDRYVEPEPKVITEPEADAEMEAALDPDDEEIAEEDVELEPVLSGIQRRKVVKDKEVKAKKSKTASEKKTKKGNR